MKRLNVLLFGFVLFPTLVSAQPDFASPVRRVEILNKQTRFFIALTLVISVRQNFGKLDENRILSNDELRAASLSLSPLVRSSHGVAPALRDGRGTP